MLLALAAEHDMPTILVPGGVTLPASDGEDSGKAQTIGVRYAHGMISMEEAAEIGCRTCASPGGGCQFLGTAATSQVVAEAFGMTLMHCGPGPVRWTKFGSIWRGARQPRCRCTCKPMASPPKLF